MDRNACSSIRIVRISDTQYTHITSTGKSTQRQSIYRVPSAAPHPSAISRPGSTCFQMVIVASMCPEVNADDAGAVRHRSSARDVEFVPRAVRTPPRSPPRSIQFPFSKSPFEKRGWKGRAEGKGLGTWNMSKETGKEDRHAV